VAGEGIVSDQVLLRDLVAIPDEVHAGDFVLALAKEVGRKSTIDDYVVTEKLAANFDWALGIVRSALETRSSRAAYLDGSFGSGKSHFMAVLYAILDGEGAARGKKGLADTVARHDPWLRDRRFLLVPYHLPGSRSLDAAILGGYVAQVAKTDPHKPLPAVYRDDGLIADARDLRERLGDDAFIAQLPEGDPDWGTGWDAAGLDTAFAEPHGGPERQRLIGDLIAGPFKRYTSAVRGEEDAFIALDEGLSVISKHAKEVLGYDAIVLLLDELVLWLAGYIGDSKKISVEAQKVSKLIESAEHERPAPIISFVPRQRDLRDLVRKDAYGAETTSLFDTLKYWDGRFDRIRMDDSNLPAIVHERLLRPKDAAAARILDEAFQRSASVPAQTWEILLDTHGEQGNREAFRLTYPFSPAFTHAMVDISNALQRQRTALKLMQQLLVDYRDTLPVGQLMPLGAIFDVLASGGDRPFTDKLLDEFEQAKRFYTLRLRPYLLQRYGLTEDQAAAVAPRHAFRGADLVVKTVLLAALVPNVPALNGLTATRLAALNHGSIVTMLPNQERALVARTLKELAAQFGEFRLSGSEDDPRVDLALIGVDTESIIRDSRHADDDAARRHLVRAMLWDELKLTDDDTFETREDIVWRGTTRAVDVLMDNVRDTDRMPSGKFQPDPDTIRMVIDYPWDEGSHSPADDVLRVAELRDQLGDTDTLVWLPHFLSDERKADLSTLIVINYVLERDRLTEVTPLLTADDRHHARTQLDSRRSALNVRLREALRRAYGVSAPDAADLGAKVTDHMLSLATGLHPRLLAGQGLRGAFERSCHQLLTHKYPGHPDFDPAGRGVAVKPAELDIVLAVVDKAAQDKVGRVEVPRSDIPVLKKIAHSLKLGVMHEAHFVLLHEWPDLINRRATGRAEVAVGKIRPWIEVEQPGLPVAVQNLIVACYAIQADKAWFRRDVPQEAPALGRITDDLALRSQELPTEEEFVAAGKRAEGIFRIKPQPVLSARSVQALAQAAQGYAREHQGNAEALAAELDKHARTLGLDDDDPRVRTARVICALLSRLTAAPDATTVVRELAAELPRENAIYLAHLESAELLVGVLRERNWRVLDDIAARADEQGQEQASAVIEPLRRAARHDEHELRLAGPLRTADKAALDLMMEWTRHSALTVVPEFGSAVRLESGQPALTVRPVFGTTVRRQEPVRVAARDVPALLEEIRELAAAHPDADFEITWQVIDRR
jgi:hypothetical protein